MPAFIDNAGRAKQSGNAVVLILVAVALFGALAATFMRGAKTGQGNLTASQAKIAAAEILSYMDNVSRAVDKLRGRGCSETELNFNNSVDEPHVNPNARPDHSCDIFHASGANLTPMDFNPTWSTQSSGVISGGNIHTFFYTNGDAIDGVGTTCATAGCSELNMNIWAITKTLCDELNIQSGNNFSSMPTNELWGCLYNDVGFDCYHGGTVNLSFTAPALKGKRKACFLDSTGTYGYIFNSVLLER